uniref:Myb/SANT-like DNA-binding domain-containing protein n=1 Tax=Pararge aegeria TaxID=116150 RepID=S4PPT9_9NEOP
MQMNQTEIMEPPDDSDDHWDHESTANMLSLYLEHIDKFRNPKIRKKNVWVDIGNAVGKGPDSCDKKFRNLKQTYIRLLRKKNKSGVTTFKWPFFDIFEEIYSVDGKYQAEIQQKIREETSDRIKAYIDMSTSKLEDSQENGGTSNGQTDEVRRRLLRKRNAEFRKVTLEMRDRQRVVEEKLDRLINTVEESNNIQRERNRLFQQFLDNLRPNH